MVIRIDSLSGRDSTAFQRDVEILCSYVSDGLAPTVAHEMLTALIARHSVSERWAKLAREDLDRDVISVNTKRRSKRGPNPDPLLDPSIEVNIEMRARRVLCLAPSKE